MGVRVGVCVRPGGWVSEWGGWVVDARVRIYNCIGDVGCVGR